MSDATLADYVMVNRSDLRLTLDHLDQASVQIGGEPCHASFVSRLRRALELPQQP